jgi:zinc transporter, ZIP family
MSDVLLAGVWGLVAGAALLVGALVGFAVRVPQKVIAGVMAFGAGVLISAVSFELVGEAYEEAGLAPAAVGALVGALA